MRSISVFVRRPACTSYLAHVSVKKTQASQRNSIESVQTKVTLGSGYRKVCAPEASHRFAGGMSTSYSTMGV